MRKLAGTSWGANETILKRVYQGTVRPHLEYGSSAWSTTAKTNQQALDKVQNQALRIITGSMKSTPIKDMEKTAAIQPLGERRDAKIMIQAEKFRYLPNHPMKQRMDWSDKESVSNVAVSSTKVEDLLENTKLTRYQDTSILPNRSSQPGMMNKPIYRSACLSTVGFSRLPKRPGQTVTGNGYDQ
ncbi:uncharacterized protein LOC121379473 [Gigantopelta aegis]|uniref:uncharacterized protein LOC121379473 n=1 Tax=Gigantopelta aegis TaxID=1735272 RepID=UPI001B88DD01|nr:uncharacterized protein LOC121379473 [Gigantopelta aegis]